MRLCAIRMCGGTRVFDPRKIYLGQKEKRACSMIILGERSKRTQCGKCWLPLTIRRAFTGALRMHLCSWQCETESRTRICCRKAFLSRAPFLLPLALVALFFAARTLFFPPECHHFGAFSLFLRSFVLSTLCGPPCRGKAS